MVDEILGRTKELLQEREAVQLIHKYFSAECFNRCWDLLDMEDRSEEEEEDMLLLAGASLWHWKQRDDCLPENLSVAYWQMGRVCCLAGLGGMADKWAGKCLEISEKEGLPPFYLGYAHEAMANASFLRKDRVGAKKHLDDALQLVAVIEDEDSKSYLQADLDALSERMNRFG